MDETEQDALRRKLLAYPGIDVGNVEQHIWRYRERADKKDELLASGFSNRLAENWLDRSGYPRPPGWHSVFFYAGSNTPGLHYVVWGIGIAGLFIWFWSR
jgi:hypothetical protein